MSTHVASAGLVSWSRLEAGFPRPPCSGSCQASPATTVPVIVIIEKPDRVGWDDRSALDATFELVIDERGAPEATSLSTGTSEQGFFTRYLSVESHHLFSFP